MFDNFSNEKIVRPPDRDPEGAGLFWKTIAILAVGGVLILGIVLVQQNNLVPAVFGPRHDFSKTYAALHIQPLPASAINDIVDRGLSELANEPCDRTAVFAVGKELIAEHENRAAADLYLGFSHACKAEDTTERAAADTFYELNDFARARDLYGDLAARFPQNDLDWYHKGKAEAGLNMPREALESYANAIAMTRDQGRLGEWVFEEMAALYASEGRFCEAMTPIETYISLGGPDRQNERSSQLLKTYSEKGRCEQRGTGSDSFPVLSSGVVNVRATINGVSGTFTVDTGATFVSLTEPFARRANLATNGVVHTHTANGDTTVELANAGTIRVGHLEAKDVPVVILSKSIGGVDGLLGRSFLSRFDIVFTEHRLILKKKAAS